ncbi:MAG: MarR family transcriptional regulator [Saccharospirillaceae bacterium]|nr:MarR family transcriptional regulator [Pseudomonadales bacterium]NRB79807.1 MarR family transcriptional regulator [Saccharospirillaceae bacterium]
MQHQVTISFIQTAQRISHEITKQLAPLDITAQQLKVLNIAYESDNQQATVNEIKANMLDPNSNVSRLLNKLSDKKWIKKIKHDDDQRIVYIKITNAGIKQMCKGKINMDKAMNCMKNLTQTDITNLHRILNKIDI